MPGDAFELLNDANLEFWAVFSTKVYLFFDKPFILKSLSAFSILELVITLSYFLVLDGGWGKQVFSLYRVLFVKEEG